MTTALRDSRVGGRMSLAPGWLWLDELRQRGMVPESHYVRVTMDCEMGFAALPIPHGPIENLDLSPVAGLDVYLIFDSRHTKGRRLQAVCHALLTAGAESLRAIDFAERCCVATLRVGHPEVGRWRPH